MSDTSIALATITDAPIGEVRQRRIHLFLAVGMLAAIVIGPIFFYPILLMKIMCFAIFACAFNLLSGHMSLLSFGHAAFFGMGAYVAGWLATTIGLTTELNLIAAGLVGGFLGAVFGALSIRREGIYMTMITLALAQVVYFVCLQASFTGGENGIQGIPRGKLFGLVDLSSDMSMYIFIACLFLLCFAVVYRILFSPTGHVLRAIRGNEARAASLGYSVNLYKVMIFAISGAMSGIAGGAKAMVFGLATLTDVHFMISGEVLLITLVGGLATIFGPIVGAVIVLILESLVASFGAWFLVAQGVLFVLCVLAFPQGMMGAIGNRLKTAL